MDFSFLWYFHNTVCYYAPSDTSSKAFDRMLELPSLFPFLLLLTHAVANLLQKQDPSQPLHSIALFLRKILLNQPCPFCFLSSPVFHIPSQVLCLRNSA